MALISGTRLGPYEILEPIGKGGMGEVYKAKDTRLDRTVAIKVLPKHLAESPERKARFEREAKAISQLNHPHICTLYDVGEQDGIDFIVMEYIEGETLAERLKKGALKLDQALEYGIQIADGLDKAHRAGIVHRDLKPGNVMLTKSGVKLLDFGLARLLEEGDDSETSDAPTRQKDLTAEESIIGTLQYMAPEQLERKPADARTDIFAFGALLYEMLTGKKAFEGTSQASLISSIMTGEPPPMASLQAMTPPLLDHVVTTCLAKTPDRRWQSVGDVERELSWIARAASNQTGSPIRRPVRSTILAILVFGVLLGVVAAVALKPAPSERRPVARFEVALPNGQQVRGQTTHNFALSPSGDQLVYISAGEDGRPQLFVRAMNSLEPRPLTGTEAAENPFFSPDGQWVGFYAAGRLKRVSIQGGAPEIICDTPVLLGASWGVDDTIVFSPVSNVGLLEVPASGGTPEVLTTLDSEKGEISHRWPHHLPGRDVVLFNIESGPNWDRWPIVAQSLDTGERHVVVEEGTDARYSPTGHLVYARAGTLMVVPFDPERLELTGDANVLVEGVRMTREGAAEYDVSGAETLVYLPGPIGEPPRSLVVLDRDGTEEPLGAPRRAYESRPILSPDGKRIALQIVSEELDVWIYDIAGQRLNRLTHEGNNQFPIWSPDGKRIAFRATRGGLRNVWSKRADGSTPEERLTTGENLQSPSSWSPDGATLIYMDADPTTGQDMWALSLDEREARAFIRTPYREAGGNFSPDGRWLAYESDETGQLEIYVQPFPGPGRKWRISTAGGQRPVWARNGELFYASGDEMMVVNVQTEPTFAAESPRPLFTFPPSVGFAGSFPFDVTPDGQRFLMVKMSEQELPATHWNIVQNWTELLKGGDTAN